MKRKLMALGLALLLSTTAIPVVPNVAHAEGKNIVDIGEGAQVIKRTADSYNNARGVVQNVEFDFIKDPSYNKDALIIKTQGFIKSRSFVRANKEDHETGEFLWPSQYKVHIKANDSNVNILNFLPGGVSIEKTKFL